MFGFNIPLYKQSELKQNINNDIFQTGLEFTALQIVKQYCTFYRPELSQLLPVKFTSCKTTVHPLSN